MNKYLHFVSVLSISFMALLPLSASAVGNGLPFTVKESYVPGSYYHKFKSDSLDYTYHACTRVNPNKQLDEQGYFWISSYQYQQRVTDSQINYYLANGYRIYGQYQFFAQQYGASQPTPTGTRLNYLLDKNNASIILYLDPQSDTALKFSPDCKVIMDKTADDIKIGWSLSIRLGEKSETDGLANGDFEVVYDNWVFNYLAPENPIIPSQTGFDILRFNANVTDLRKALGKEHYPEGSGNLYWQNKNTPLPTPILLVK